MFDKTLGIVLGSVQYNDHTQFIHIYTEKFGKVTYKTSIRHTKRLSTQKMMFSPMTLLDLDVIHTESEELQKIKESAILSSPLLFGNNDPLKYSQCLFMAELIDRSIREVEQNKLLWDYIYNSLEFFSMTEGVSPDFHILFTAKLCIPLGFGIDESVYESGMLFDMNEGCFTADKIYHPYYLNSISAEYLYRLLKSNYTNLSLLNYSKTERNIMLDILISYLKLHIPEIGELKSLDVLKELSE